MSVIEGILRHENTVLRRIVWKQGLAIKKARADIRRYREGVEGKDFEPAKIALDVDHLLESHQLSLVPLVSELDGVNLCIKHRATQKGQRQITSAVFDVPSAPGNGNSKRD